MPGSGAVPPEAAAVAVALLVTPPVLGMLPPFPVGLLELLAFPLQPMAIVPSKTKTVNRLGLDSRMRYWCLPKNRHVVSEVIELDNSPEVIAIAYVMQTRELMVQSPVACLSKPALLTWRANVRQLLIELVAARDPRNPRWHPRRGGLRNVDLLLKR